MASSKKYVIGLTGNIATGKSVVRKMLEHLGAYGIDADALTHRALAKGAPGYQPVVDEFGKYILGDGAQIDRGKLGKLVFSDAEALAKLEGIIHPFVRQAIAHLIKNAPQDVIVVEAIKLLESPVKDTADTIWVTTASEDVQRSRLKEKRNMGAAEADQRMSAQSSQADKVAAADIVIENNGDFDNAWKQVQAAWKSAFPEISTGDSDPVPTVQSDGDAAVKTALADLNVVRGNPKHAEAIANFINQVGKSSLSRVDVMAAFGEKAYMLLLAGEQIVGVMGWQVENLVSRTDEVWLADGLDPAEGIRVMMAEVEDASKQLQAEAAMVFVSPEMADRAEVWDELGYENREPDSLSVSAWIEAANETLSSDNVMLFKQLRVDRVLRPI